MELSEALADDDGGALRLFERPDGWGAHVYGDDATALAKLVGCCRCSPLPLTDRSSLEVCQL